MVRRSPPRKTLDERSFPVRMRIENPWKTCGSLRWTDAEVWLRENIGPGDFASYGGYVMEYHFRSVGAAQAFLEAFPDLSLADYTEHVGHLREARRHRKQEQASSEIPRLPHWD